MSVFSYYLREKNGEPMCYHLVNKCHYYKWYYFAGKVRDVDGERVNYKQKHFKTYEAAAIAEEQYLADWEEIKHGRIDFNDLWKKYLSYSKRKKEQTTIEDDTAKYLNHIEPYFGSRWVKTVSPEEIINWHETLESNLARGSVRNCHKVLSKLFNFYELLYGVTWNPCRAVGTPKKIHDDSKFVLWTTKEFTQFYNCIHSLDDQCLFLLFFYGGLRRGEALALRWNRIQGNILCIRRSIAKIEGGTKEKSTKNSVIRHVEYPEFVINKLMRLKELRMHDDTFSEDDFIFRNKRTGKKPLSPTTITNRKDKYCEQAGLKQIDFHEFRHSHISNLLAENMPVKAVADRVGDTVDTILETYVHLMPSSNPLIVGVLNKDKDLYL
ncbi:MULTISPECIES: site-specific integrase [unclassified Breznakia]|uniref:tyrosine-type recombinase/integrase n=1 Tax=unclassified Breznakia TaxID=2623764 RepID=UPI002473CEFA|nr:MULTISPECIES: site-specific integrase [unclassified Breznakia]MDH6367408.1 integrase [Breznakia sp. PH1-1]MDH6403940.1 integrase [Breznakia sp. PF1-11]MDH6411649.1 integrase [Breznakia sp. PFB1-11]MDH6414575.1 integrase [Breznakia sp. PFB1-14]MDH6418681.1 integrase [Breznakia sp. PFB1-12]